MKRRLTLRFLISNIVLINVMYFIFITFNIITFKTEFAFTDDFFNYSFSSSEVTEEYVRDLTEINENGKYELDSENEKILFENNIWIQVIDEGLQEVYSLNKADTIPSKYTVGQLYRYSGKPWEMTPSSTLNIREMSKDGKAYTFIIGYPYEKVKTITVGFTNEHYLYIGTMISFALILTLVIGYLFSMKLASPISGIIEDIDLLAEGKFISRSKRNKSSIYNEVNENILKLSNTLQENKKEKDKIDNLKEEWIANMAHDLKTPLASINGYAQMLNEDYNNSEEDVKRYGEIIIDKTRYIEDLIGDLTLVYKFKNNVVPMIKKEENIVEVIRDTVIDILNNPIYSDREIEIDSNWENVLIECHKSYIVRAINNLIYNAIVHNPKETKIKISIDKMKDKILITIEDNGNGISEEDLKILFDRYFRASNTGETHKGSGLGMAISKEIIEAHGGTINVQSHLGEGTKTTIEFQCRK